MGKNRYVNTRMWRDDYFSELDPSEKLLFVYCLTNPDTNLCGIYEVPTKIIATDTGMSRDVIHEILSRFERDGKVLYRDGWLAIKNFMRYQKFNPKVEIAVKKELEGVPAELKEWVDSDSIPIAYRKPIDRQNKDKSIDKDKSKKFQKPCIEELSGYIKEKGYRIDPEQFWNFYESKGWKIGKNKMKSWQAACVTWEKRSGNALGQSSKAVRAWDEVIKAARNGKGESDLKDDLSREVVKKAFEYGLSTIGRCSNDYQLEQMKKEFLGRYKAAL